ncbi:hypothetical protein J5Y03_16360 [Bacillus sp. RG28]|uniref:BioF2-like acetyltransferase domain-containing protein n=1 Tax=Gottfriedia endophytica TaxID=2820819 RepID=A0A940NM08_9BACI|nr:hypothetical protein [Gottfriedia endophytica]MBP0726732.1 hypothetical protein [Gottfriedia endophytica]
MIVTYEEAIRIYESFPDKVKAPTLHPEYVMIDSYRDQSIQPEFFVYKEEQDIFYLPIHISNYRNITDIQSQYGYGGSISNTESKEFIKRANNEFVKWANNNRFIAGFFRLHPTLQNYNFLETDHFFNRYVVEVDLTPTNIEENYKYRVKRVINRTKKINHDTKIVEEVDSKVLNEIFLLYTSAMKEKNTSEFYFFNKKYFESLVNWSHSFICTSHYNGELVGVNIYIWDGEEVNYHLGCTNDMGKKFGISFLMMKKAIDFSKKRNFKKLLLGGGFTTSEDDSLLHFKKGFSDKLLEYHIGSQIYRKNQYRKLKEEYKKNNLDTNKILFYREN